MEKRTLWMLAALVTALIVTVVLFCFATSRGYEAFCSMGSCHENWGGGTGDKSSGQQTPLYSGPLKKN